MIEASLSNTLAFLTAILLIIFSFVAASQRKLSSVLLAGFLLSNSFYIIDYLINPIGRSFGISIEWFEGIGLSFGYLFGPFLFLYVTATTKRNYKFSKIQLWHCFLFGISILVVIVDIDIPWQAVYGILNFQVLLYLIFSISLIRSYRITFKDHFSSIERINLNWLLFVLVGFFLGWFIDLINVTGHALKLFPLNDGLNTLSIFMNFVFSILLFYKALKQPQVLLDASEQPPIKKYKNSKLKIEEKDELLKIIEDHFKSEKPFLNPSLTISNVSKSINVPSKHISQVINESLNKNFYDFTNSYRINEAIIHLCENKDSAKTILEILYQSGFNSKSAFNAVFKKQTGMTPTEFRQENSNT